MATAQYVVDIATNMNADPTIAQLDEVSKQLSAGGKNADFFSGALAKVSDDLNAAKTASAAAVASLKEGEQTFAGLERAAVQAAKAEEKAALAGKLSPEIARAAFQSKAAVDAYALTLKSLEQNAAAAIAREEELTGTFDNVKKLSSQVNASLSGSAETTEKLRGSLASVPGPVGKLGSALLAPVQGFQKLRSEMGASNAAMLLGVTAAAAVAIAIVAVGVAALAAAAKVAAWAVGLSDANRNAALSQQAVNALHPEIAALSGSYAALTDETGQSSAKLNDLAKQLIAAKVSANDLPAALRAAATAETALAGNGGASKFLEDIKAGKVAVGELAAETQAKFGGIVAKQMMGLDAQSARLKKNVSDLFGGLNIDPVLEGLRTLADLFDKNTAAGQAMQLLFESVFQPIIDQAQNAAYFVEAFVLGFLIGLTKLYIAVKPAIKAVSEFFGFEDSSLSDGLNIAKIAGEAIVPVVLGLVAVFGAVIAVIGLAVAQLFLIPAAAAAVVAAVVYAGLAVVQWVIGAWQQAKDFLAGVDLGQIGSDIIQGLADGISGAAGNVLKAITGVVGGAVDSAKKLLGIASPSKVFAEIGDNTGAGMVEGVEGVTGDVQDAFASMVEPPDVPASALEAQDTPWGASVSPGAGGSAPQVSDTGPSGAAASKGGKSSGVDLSGATLNFYGVKDAENARDLFEEMLTRVLEGDAASIAGEAAPV